MTGADFYFEKTSSGLCLLQHEAPDFRLLAPDFSGGAADHRRKFGGGKGQMIAKAVGLSSGVFPHIWDATAGFGADAFVLASLGAKVSLIERHPLIAPLLKDALLRGAENEAISLIMARMRLIEADAISYLKQASDTPEVIYLDPMFPARQKSAAVKKNMRLFRLLVGDDEDASDLFHAAFEKASHRVVVKRPRLASRISDKVPSYVLEGQSSRFDIYVKAALKKTN